MRPPLRLAAPLALLPLALAPQSGAGGIFRDAAQDEAPADDPFAPEVVPLADGVTYSGTLDLSVQAWADFRFEVPSDAVLLRVTLESPRADLDLYGERGAYIEDAELASYLGASAPSAARPR